jgi:cytochrome c
MPSTRLMLCLVGGLALMSVRAAADPPAPLPAPPGQAIAQRVCARCHSLGPASTGRLGAPPFRAIALRYNELSLERRLSKMNGKAHSDMPKVTLQPGEISDLAAYISGLR